MAYMKPFVQIFSLGIKLWAWLLVCAFLAANHAGAATQTLLLRPDCAMIRIMDPAQTPLACRAPQKGAQSDTIRGSQTAKTQVKAVSFQIEANAKTLRGFNIPHTAKPLPLPQQLGHPDDHWMATLSHPLQTWEATRSSLKCCELLRLQTPPAASMVRLGFQETFVIYSMIGLTLYGLILIKLNARRAPRGRRRRRRTRVPASLRYAPSPLRLMPRQRIDRIAVNLAA